MTKTGDFYKDAGGIGKVGSIFTEFMMAYRCFMDPLVAEVKSPAYVRDLLGEYTVPSMHLRLPVDDPPVSPVNLNRKPFHVARIVNETHRQLMGLMRNIRLTTPEPEAFANGLLATPKFQEVVKRSFKGIAIQMGGKWEGPTSGDEALLKEELQYLGDMLNACRPEIVPNLTFELEDVKTREKRTVHVPNIMIKQPPSEHIRGSRMPTGLPLAGIAWGLGKATQGSLLASPVTGFIQFMVGTQAGLTMSMQEIMKAIAPHMPPGKNLDDYLVKDGTTLTQVIREEAHHLQIWRAMGKSELWKTIDMERLLDVAGVPMQASLRDKPEYVARDTACLLYATSNGFRKTRQLLSQAGPDDAKMMRTRSQVEGKTGFSTDLQTMIAELQRMADDVYKCGSPTEVIARLREPRNMILLKDANRRAGILNQNMAFADQSGQLTRVDISEGLRLIQHDLLPELPEIQLDTTAPRRIQQR